MGEKNTNKSIQTILYILVLIILTVLGTYFFYKKFETKNPSIISSLVINLSEASNTVEEGDTNKYYIKPHTFKVSNGGVADAKYKVMFEDKNRESSIVKKDEMYYELILNHSVIKTGTIKSLVDSGGVLDLRDIKASSVNNYELKVWIDDTINAKGFSYTYYLKILPIEEK